MNLLLNPNFVLYYLLPALGLGYLIYQITILIVTKVLPPLHPKVIEHFQRVQERTANLDWDSSHSDIDRLDDVLFHAEIERPGSTLRLYLHPRGMPNVIASLLIGFGLTALLWSWILIENFPIFNMDAIAFFRWMRWVGLGLGAFVYLSPVTMWYVSVPR